MPLHIEGAIDLRGRKAPDVTDRRLPTIVLGGTNSGGDGAVHDPLVHPELYEGVALRRLMAFFLDLILLGIVLLVAWIAAGVLWALSLFIIAIPMTAASLIFVVLYDVLTIGGPASATPGMRAFGLKVVTWSGGRPDNLQALLMSAMFWTIHSLTGGLAAVVALLNPRWRCAHDFLAGTVVVRAA
jgi:uncharacterized RDD family membrane protein YckC